MANTGAEYEEFQTQNAGISWRRFFIILFLIAAVIIGFALASRFGPTLTAPAQRPAPATVVYNVAGLTPPLPQPGPGLLDVLQVPFNAATRAQIVATVENFGSDPAANVSKPVLENVRQQAAANGQTLNDAQVAATLNSGFTPGLQLKTNPDTLTLPFAGKQDVAVVYGSATVQGNATPENIRVTLLKENGSWKIANLEQLRPTQ